MKRNADQIMEELKTQTPDVSLNIFSVETGEEGLGGIALSVDFKESEPPKTFEDATVPQLIAMKLAKEFSDILKDMQGEIVHDSTEGNMERVLSSAASKAKQQVRDDIDKQLAEMGITIPKGDSDVTH